MANKAFEAFNELPAWAKGTMAVVVVGGIALFTMDTIKRIKADAKKGEANAAKNELNKLAQKGILPTITESQAMGYTKQLVAAADDFGTDEAKMYNVFSNLKNDADVYLLISTFGVQEWKGTWSSYFSNEMGTLSYLLSYELSSSEIAKINKTLADKGINYKF